MENTCFYCQEETIVEEFKNPNTYETHPTCEKCKAELSTYNRELKFFVKLIWPGIPLLIFFSIISFIFVDWQTGVLFIAIAIFAGMVSYFGLEYFRTKKEKKLGTYVDVKNIQWCKTCKYYKKVKSYKNELWQSQEIVGDSEIPCKILNDTKAVWAEFFNMESGQRTLYPKNCERWTKK